MFFRDNALHLSLQLVSDPFHISQDPGGVFYPSIGQVDLKLQSLDGGHVYRCLSLVFGGNFHHRKMFG
jgi:hypothetical protein